jgi:hypothetical protein
LIINRFFCISERISLISLGVVLVSLVLLSFWNRHYRLITEHYTRFLVSASGRQFSRFCWQRPRPHIYCPVFRPGFKARFFFYFGFPFDNLSHDWLCSINKRACEHNVLTFFAYRTQRNLSFSQRMPKQKRAIIRFV